MNQVNTPQKTISAADKMSNIKRMMAENIKRMIAESDDNVQARVRVIVLHKVRPRVALLAREIRAHKDFRGNATRLRVDNAWRIDAENESMRSLLSEWFRAYHIACCELLGTERSKIERRRKDPSDVSDRPYYLYTRVGAIKDAIYLDAKNCSERKLDAIKANIDSLVKASRAFLVSKTAEIQDSVIERQNGLCYYCGNEISNNNSDFDEFFIPGPNNRMGAKTVCVACNRCINARKNASLSDWRSSLQFWDCITGSYDNWPEWKDHSRDIAIARITEILNRDKVFVRQEPKRSTIYKLLEGLSTECI
jgi:hypothetical protein